MLENPVVSVRYSSVVSHPLHRVRDMMGSDNPTVSDRKQITPENQQETVRAGSSEAIRRPSRSIASEMKRWSRPGGDAGTPDRPAANGLLAKTGKSEIPCRVSNYLPLEGVIPQANPANNGEPPPRVIERGIPWEVGSDQLPDPVTTEAKAEMAFPPDGKFTNAIRRRPSSVDLSSYIAGYVDGEGCFCVSFRPQSRIRVGWEVRPSFSVSQNGDRAEIITMMPEFFGCGTIRPDRSDRTLKYEVRSLSDLSESVIPFFKRVPLLSSKSSDFEAFASICGLMVARRHLDSAGLWQIAALAAKMNSSGLRRYSLAELISR
jgi:hypothetical protein